MAKDDVISKFLTFVRELKRRKIFRVVIVYSGVAFITLQIADLLVPALKLPQWTMSLVFILLAIGFVIAVISAWAFEITPEGVVRITDSEKSEEHDPPHGGKPFTGDAAIVGLLVIIVGILLYQGVFSSSSTGKVDTHTLAGDSLEAGNETFNARLGQKSIAVIPFSYLAAEDSADYFSIGITDELLSRLAQIKALAVIGRTTVMQYQDTDKTFQEIGKELGVAHLLEGSVQLVGNRVRIQAQLIDANSGTHLWADTYNREIKNILALQSEVTSRIAKSLEAELLPKERQLLTTYGDVNERAYHLYLRAQHLRNRRDSAGVAKARELFRESIAHDSTFAPAYGGLAMATYWSGHVGEMTYDTAEPLALEAAEEALKRDTTVVEAYLTKALVNKYMKNFDLSEQAFKRVFQLNPNHSEARGEYGYYLLQMGQIDSALAQMEQAVELDPHSWDAHEKLGYALYCNHRYEEAIQELETAFNLGGSTIRTGWHLINALTKQGQILARQGRMVEAEAVLKRIIEVVEPLDVDTHEQSLIRHTVKLQEEQALETIEQATIRPFIEMRTYLLLDLDEKALELLMQQKIQQRDQVISLFGELVYFEAMYDSVRNASRFKRIILEGMDPQG